MEVEEVEEEDGAATTASPNTSRWAKAAAGTRPSSGTLSPASWQSSRPKATKVNKRRRREEG